MDIPVFHDDQHGTAIISLAGLINALQLTGRDIKTAKLVCNGAGAAAIACVELAKAYGMAHDNVIICDTKGVVYQGRTEGMNQWKSAHAVETKLRTLEEAMRGADVAFGLSAKGAYSREMIASMAKNPIIFAMANPDPEITPEEVAEIRDDAIMATGRSDYANQVNNVLGFPYIFRGALDVRATTINDAMKLAAAEALAALAREDVPDEVVAAYQGNRPRFGPRYIIPVPFDPRLISAIPPAVAKAAMETGVARRPIEDMEAYRHQLSARRDPIAGTLQQITARVRQNPQRIVFAEGEEEAVIRAAVSFATQRFGTPILVGREDLVKQRAAEAGIELKDGIEIMNARLSTRRDVYADYLYKRLQRDGYLHRDCARLINTDRNHFAACMVALGDADGLVTGITRSYSTVLQDHPPLHRHRSPAIASSASRSRSAAAAPWSSPTPRCTTCRTRRSSPTSPKEAAGVARRLGFDPPRVAMLAYSTFGNSSGRARREGEGGGAHPRQPRSTSNTTARWAPTWRSIRRDGVLSVLPPVRARPTCWSCRRATPRRSRPTCCRNSAARRCSGRSSSASTARCRSCRSPLAIPTSSTWPRSRPTTSAGEGFRAQLLPRQPDDPSEPRDHVPGSDVEPEQREVREAGVARGVRVAGEEEAFRLSVRIARAATGERQTERRHRLAAGGRLPDKKQRGARVAVEVPGVLGEAGKQQQRRPVGRRRGHDIRGEWRPVGQQRRQRRGASGHQQVARKFLIR